MQVSRLPRALRGADHGSSEPQLSPLPGATLSRQVGTVKTPQLLISARSGMRLLKLLLEEQFVSEAKSPYERGRNSGEYLLPGHEPDGRREDREDASVHVHWECWRTAWWNTFGAHNFAVFPAFQDCGLEFPSLPRFRVSTTFFSTISTRRLTLEGKSN